MRRRAFTLMEVTLVSMLMALLVLLLSSTWFGACRPTLDLIVRAELLREADMAVGSLARDFGGALTNPGNPNDPGDTDNPAGWFGGKKQWQWVGWADASGTELWLYFDGGAEPSGGPSAEDRIIYYRMQDGALIRGDQTASTEVPVAKHLSNFQVISEGSDSFRVVMTFTFRNLTNTCTIHARVP